MAPSTNSTYYYLLHGLKVAITVAFIFFLTLLLLLPPKSAGGSVVLSEESKKVIGSKPPACVNKCSNCRPCMATLVVPNHQRKGFKKVSSHGEDDGYYLLSWKCRCGNKLFQP
ncbi:hypothetical protein L6164_004489 [Bauhinia variegata]|uniref:Uncharacterized protein n=1 Tax=Bauhinia variegata TaxID=167791 RepID=A0ACB9Q6M1_BAUVA|nr:hypothetical protein L6164_004489 [Bauhinia variegata]